MAKKKNLNLFPRKKAIDVNLGALTQEKKDALFQCREALIVFQNAMMQDAFQKDFLGVNTSKTHIQKTYTLPFQKHYDQPINKAYLEKGRKSVEASLVEQYKRMKTALLNALHNIDKKAFLTPREKRRLKRENKPFPIYHYIGVEIQGAIQEDDLKTIQKAFKAVDEEKRLQWIRAILIDGDKKKLSELQIAILHSVYESIQARYSIPRFGINDDFTLTLDLDYRLFQIGHYKQHLHDMEQHYQWLVDKNNQRYDLFLELTNPIKGHNLKRIRLPVKLNKQLFHRAIQVSPEIKTTVQSLSLVIRHNKIALKSVISRDDIVQDLETQYQALNKANYLIGRDFGYTDTISLRVIENEFNESFESFKNRMSFNKDDTKALYQTHGYEPKVVKEFQANGRSFMASLKKTSLQIDKIKSEINHIYNKIEALIFNIRNYLKINHDELLHQGTLTDNAFVNFLIKRFFTLLNVVKNRKAKVRAHYKKIAGKKRSWFGFLINIEKRLCKEYNAVMVVEDLTTMAVEKDKPDYKGRAFNKMINNGSKGQYMRLAKAQHFWNGISEIRIPAFYSSKTCTKHAIVEDKPQSMRNGKVFQCPECKNKEDADLHASSTIASFLLLRALPSR